MTHNILDIIKGTSVDGPGLRTSIYIAGCSHKCEGCHNPDSWNANGGTLMTTDEILSIIVEEDFNVTLSGGDPLFNPLKTANLAKAINEAGYTIWLYTGYSWEHIINDKMLAMPLPYVNTIVDGPYIKALRDESLRFRGSLNQRIIDVQKSLSYNRLILSEYS